MQIDIWQPQRIFAFFPLFFPLSSFFFSFLPSFLSFLFSLFTRAAYRMMTARMQRFEATSAMFLRWIQKTKETKERWVKYGCGRERWKERGRGRKRAGELKNCRPWTKCFRKNELSFFFLLFYNLFLSFFLSSWS